MGFNAHTITIGDVLEFSQGSVKTGPFGTKLSASEYSDVGVPVISVGEIRYGSLSVSERTKRVGSDVTQRMPEYLLAPGDIVFGRKGAVDRSAWIKPHEEGYFLGSDGIRLRFGRNVNSRFMAYQLQSARVRTWLLQHVGGTTLASLNEPTLKSVPVHLPSTDVQHAVVAILGALDDKIDSNRRLARLLEETAAALFRARFVDLVGVEEFEDSEVGPIPSGWRAGSLADIASVYRDFGSGQNELPYIGLDAMPRKSTVLADWSTADAPRGQTARFERGDILFGKLRPYFHKVGVAPIRGRCSTEILVLRPIDPMSYGLLLGHVSSTAFIDHCVAVSRGTRMPRAEWKDAGTFRIALPSVPTLREFDDLVRTVYAQIIGLTHESRTLAAARDALLPKLISGEIRVPDTLDSAEVIEPLVA